MLREVPLCAIGNLWQQRRVSLLSGHEKLQGQSEVPLEFRIMCVVLATIEHKYRLFIYLCVIFVIGRRM